MDFTDAESHMIGQIMKAERSMPDDFWTVAAVQEFACILVKIEPLLPDADMATLIGIGACLVRHSKAEMMAGIEASMAIGRAQNAARKEAP